MIIGIAGLPELTCNYAEAVSIAADRTASSSFAAFSSVSFAASPFGRRMRRESYAKPEIEVSLLPRRAQRWDALILPGGGDIDPALLPGKPPLDPHCHDVDPVLDRQQLSLLELFIQKKKPILGICKGMQLICLHFGGDLIQHLETAEAHRYKECDQFHSVHAAPGSFLFDLYGSRFVVNSAHHQGIRVPPSAYASGCPMPPLYCKTQPPDTDASQSPAEPAFSAAHSFPLSVIQASDDGVPEGLIHKTLPIIGLQWHPERLCGRFARQDAVDGSLVFQYFLSLIPK